MLSRRTQENATEFHHILSIICQPGRPSASTPVVPALPYTVAGGSPATPPKPGTPNNPGAAAEEPGTRPARRERERESKGHGAKSARGCALVEPRGTARKHPSEQEDGTRRGRLMKEGVRLRLQLPLRPTLGRVYRCSNRNIQHLRLGIFKSNYSTSNCNIRNL